MSFRHTLLYMLSKIQDNKNRVLWKGRKKLKDYKEANNASAELKPASEAVVSAENGVSKAKDTLEKHL